MFLGTGSRALEFYDIKVDVLLDFLPHCQQIVRLPRITKLISKCAKNQIWVPELWIEFSSYMLNSNRTHEPS